MKKASLIVPILTEWRRRIIAMERQLDALRTVVGGVECPLGDAAIELMIAYTKATAIRVGDVDEWLDWYWMENDMGHRRGMCKAARWKKLRPIGTVLQLAQLIEATA